MRPAARVQAAIELLDAIIAACCDNGAAADTLIQRYFASRRYAGSKDRRAVRELVYAVIRALGERPDSGRAAMIGYARTLSPNLLALFTGGPHAPLPIGDEAGATTGLAPSWLEAKFAAAYGADAPTLLAALADRAPLDLRVNRLKADRACVMSRLADVLPTPLAPDGLRAVRDFDVTQSDVWREGAIEVQDEGSQLVALACAPDRDATVIDLCAGAGGKSLALAATMANGGRIVACDSSRTRLQRLAPRALRAGVTNIESRLLDPGRERQALTGLFGGADVVLIDAPCSGTGTWRRNPEARWRLSEPALAGLCRLQSRLIDIAAELTAPGGRLVYAVCSLLPDEGERQADRFAAANPGWRPALPGLLPQHAPGRALLTPARHGTDGFFIAAFQKPC
jgi:16S rRNA (cytosine967-C5)-methyltransferase